MAVRDDVSIDWDVSPRIITVAAPSTEITMQDLLDTLRTLESAAGAMDNDAIVDAAGKENLGGGVLVGLTVTLLNAKLAFEARLGPGWTLCSIMGGNCVAVDADGNDMDVRQPTAYVTIDRVSSSSATLQIAADVKASLVEALATDTYPESAAPPAATASIVAKISWICTLALNKIFQSTTQQRVRNTADDTDVGTAPVSDDGSTFIRGKWS